MLIDVILKFKKKYLSTEKWKLIHNEGRMNSHILISSEHFINSVKKCSSYCEKNSCLSFSYSIKKQHCLISKYRLINSTFSTTIQTDSDYFTMSFVDCHLNIEMCSKLCNF